MKETKRVQWADSGVDPHRYSPEYEVDKDLPGDRAFRVYGTVHSTPTGFDPKTGGPDGFDTVIYITGMSYWPTPLIVKELSSLEEATELTGLTADALGELVFRSYLDDLEDTSE